MDNAKLCICYIYTCIYIYICMYGWYVCPLNACTGSIFSPKNTAFRLDSTFFWYKSYLNLGYKLWDNSFETLVFEVPKSYCERLLWHWNPLPNVIFKTASFFGGCKMLLVGCQVPLVARAAKIKTKGATIVWEKLS